MSRRPCLVFISALALVACNQAGKGQSAGDAVSDNTHFKQAQQQLDAGDAADAAAQYEDALADNPKLAQAHYELGVIYGDKLNDPVDSIYHYRRYLALDTTSDKKGAVQEQMDKESQAFAASLLGPSGGGNTSDLTKLETENAALKKQVTDASHTISQLQAQLKHHHAGATAMSSPAPGSPEAAAPAPPPLGDMNTNTPAAGIAANGTGAPSATPANVAPAAPPRAVAVDTNAPDVNAPEEAATTNAAPTGPSRSYTVIKGDSLWKIAHKMYPGDTKNGEDKIREANQQVFNGKFLKLGQVLVIPQ